MTAQVIPLRQQQQKQQPQQPIKPNEDRLWAALRRQG